MQGEAIVLMSPEDAERLLAMLERTEPISLAEACTQIRLRSLVDRVNKMMQAKVDR
jgi:hypothetical protein